MAEKWTEGGWGWTNGSVGWWCSLRTITTIYTDRVEIEVSSWIKSNCRIDYNSINGAVSNGHGWEYPNYIAYKHPSGGSHKAQVTSHTYSYPRKYSDYQAWVGARVVLGGDLSGDSQPGLHIDIPKKSVAAPTITSAQFSGGKYVDLALRINCPDADKLQIWRKKNNSEQTKIYDGSPIRSFRDTIATPGVYVYRAANWAQGADSPWTPWTREFTVVAIPSAPTITNVERLGTQQTRISLNLNSSSTTALYLYRQKSGQTSETLVYSSTPVTSFTDNPGTGTFRYRAKNHNSAGDSEYSPWSQWVSTIKPPNAPTITSPASSAVVSSQGPMVLQWRHNPGDGSVQTKAEIKVQGTKTPAKTYTVTGATNSYSLNGLPGNQDISFQVRTKGLHPDFSPWSAVRKFKYLAPITAAIKPVGVVKKFPIAISWTYEDGYGSQSSAFVQLKLNGITVAEQQKASEKNVVFNKDSFSIKDSSQYTIILTVRSTSGVTTQATSKFTTNLAVPGVPTAEVVANNKNANVSITPHSTAGDIPTQSFSILRNGKLIAEKLADGTTIADSTAPVDEPLEYEIKAVSDLGTSASFIAHTELKSNGFAFINFEEGFSDMAKLAMDLKLSEKVEIDKTMMVTPSRRFPVVIYGENETVTGSLSAKTWWLEDMSQEGQKAMCAQFEKLARYKGVCLLRLPHQEPKYVIVEVGISKGEAYNLAGISIDYLEVDGSGLD